MNRDLNAIKCKISAIESAESNIKRYDTFGEHKELLLMPNGPKIQELIKAMGYSDTENPKPIYLSGNSKDAVLIALTAEQNKFKEKMTASLEELIKTD